MVSETDKPLRRGRAVYVADKLTTGRVIHRYDGDVYLIKLVTGTEVRRHISQLIMDTHSD